MLIGLIASSSFGAISHSCALAHVLAVPWPLLTIHSDTYTRAAPLTD